MLLAIVFDLSEKLSEFIANKASLSAILFTYYWNFILYFGNMFSPMIVFISVIWFTAKLAQDSEIIPMLNSGKPFSRILRPYMIAATFLMLISLVLNHLVIPNANKGRLDFEESFYRNAVYLDDYYAEFPGDEIVYFDSYSATDSLLNNFTVEKWYGDDSLKSILHAKSVKNLPNSKKWILNDYYIRVIGKEDGELEMGHEKDTVFNFKIDDMVTRDSYADAMNFTELAGYIKREKAKGNPDIAKFQLVMHRRTAFPFATYILTIIGFSVSSRKKRGGIGINIAIGFALIFVFIFAMQVMDVAAQNIGFPPLLAVWTPNIIFALFALILYRFAKK